MIIYVDAATLKPGHTDAILAAGALSAMIRLSRLGHEFIIDLRVDKQILHIIHLEEIEIHEGDAPDAKLSKHSEDDELILSFADSSKDPITYESWKAFSEHLSYPTSRVTHKRTTAETDISIDLNLFGEGRSEIDTGIGFFDHMLDQIAKHALLDMKLTCKGDLHIDEHHTIEDVAITLGEALYKGIGDKKGLERFGFVLPMDETRAEISMDLSGRPYLAFQCPLKRPFVGEFPTEMTEHFFYSLAMNLKATLHIEVRGDNDHHKIEATFKGFARTLRQALIRLERSQHIIPSSKGSL